MGKPAGWTAVLLGIAGLAIANLASARLAAQTVPPAVPPIAPQIAVPTRDQVQPPVPPTAPPRASIDSRNSFAATPCALAGSPLRVGIDRIRFAPLGRPALPLQVAAILNGVAPAVTGDQPIENVCEIRDRANAALRRAGYVASVQIPPQEITTGELALAVVMARITEIRVRGEPGPHAAMLARRLDRIRGLDPLNEREIERLLLLAGDVPGLDVQLSLRPAGTAPGDVIGDVSITSARFALFGNVQNYGSRQLGRETGYARGEIYGLLTGADMLYVAGSSTLDFREQQVAQIGYTTGLGAAGTTLGVRATHAWSRPDLDTLDLRSRTLIAGFDIGQPVLRSVDSNLTVGGGFELLEQKTQVFGGAAPSPLNQDKLRVVFARMSGNYRIPRAGGGDLFALGGSIEVRKGLAILGASQAGVTTSEGFTLSRFEGDPQAVVVRANLDAELGLGRLFRIAGQARGQWANHPLVNLEEYAIGNLSIGRGYDPGSNAGDRAIGLRGEPRLRLPLDLPVVIEVLGFFDAVWLRNLDSNTTEARRTLTAWGGGLNVQLPGRLSLELLYAKPRNKALSLDKAPPAGRLLVSLTARFSPNAR